MAVLRVTFLEQWGALIGWFFSLFHQSYPHSLWSPALIFFLNFILLFLYTGPSFSPISVSPVSPSLASVTPLSLPRRPTHWELGTPRNIRFCFGWNCPPSHPCAEVLTPRTSACKGIRLTWGHWGGLTLYDCVAYYWLLQPGQDSKRGCRGPCGLEVWRIRVTTSVFQVLLLVEFHTLCG